MEIAWLEDFLAVSGSGSFSRAAEERHITQPALSRRIRALEEWVGTPLFFRTTHKVELTPAGDSFRQTAEDVLRRLAVGRSIAREQASGSIEQLQFAATNALALTFFPGWLRTVEHRLPFVANIHLVANHMVACERLMLQGQAQFLLAHHHPAADTLLTPRQFLSHPVGVDVLIPVSAPTGEGGGPSFALPGTEAHALPYLSYRPESGMGRIIAAVREGAPERAFLRPCFESHVAKLLVTMAVEGRGLAFLPKSLIGEELAQGTLVRAGDTTWDITIEIQLFRPRTRLSSTAEAFWATVAGGGTVDRR
ncbi:LysR family transcriptional regulator [Xanthobacter autotrophicus]|uniref:LysR family transcriptional regulator n=1 Tax=Xanthobacter autotrophicus TaxID=280 RepID=UPI00372A4635